MVEKNKSFQVGAHIVMVFLSLCCILPFVLLIASSFTDENELIRSGYSFIPAKFSLDAYAYMFKSSNKIFNAYGITILVTVIGTVAGLAMTVLMAYPLSRRDLPGRNGLAFYVFFTMLFSGGLVPTYMMYTRYIKVSSTIWALIVPSLLVNAFYVIMMRTYFNTNIPDAVIEAARIDGAGEFRILGTVVIPDERPDDRDDDAADRSFLLERLEKRSLLPPAVQEPVQYTGASKRDAARRAGAEKRHGRSLRGRDRGNDAEHRHPHGDRRRRRSPGPHRVPVLPEVFCQGHHDRRSQGLI